MTHLRRQTLTDAATPSIEPRSHSGEGTAVREDNSTPEIGRRGVTAVMRGRRIDLAPIHEEKTDLVTTGRAQILARSGNDAGQHEEEWEDTGEGFEELAAGDPVAERPLGRADLLLALGVGLFAWWAWRQ